MNKAIHEGRNVKRIREILDVKQEVLAADMGISQQRLSEIEKKEKLDEELMEQIAGILKVPIEAIKNFDEEAAVNIIANNCYDHSASVNYYCTFNPVEKWIESLKKNEELYERLLQAEREKNELLQKLVNARN